MNNFGQRLLLACGLTAVLVGCAAKEYAGFSRNQSNWLNADTEAAEMAEDVSEPNIEPRTHFAAGQLFEQQGQLRKAVIQYRKCLATAPDYVAAHNRLGVLLGRLGRHTEAEASLRKAVELRPDWAFLRNNLGFEYMLQERWADAEAELRNAVHLKSDFARAHNNLAIVLFKLGRHNESLGEFHEAIPPADAYYNLGLLFQGEGRFRDAADAFERVLSLAPEFEAAKTQLARVAPRLERETPLEPMAHMPDWDAVAKMDSPVAVPQALGGDEQPEVQSDSTPADMVSEPTPDAVEIETQAVVVAAVSKPEIKPAPAVEPTPEADLPEPLAGTEVADPEPILDSAPEVVTTETPIVAMTIIPNPEPIDAEPFTSETELPGLLDPPVVPVVTAPHPHTSSAGIFGENVFAVRPPAIEEAEAVALSQSDHGPAPTLWLLDENVFAANLGPVEHASIEVAKPQSNPAGAVTPREQDQVFRGTVVPELRDLVELFDDDYRAPMPPLGS